MARTFKLIGMVLTAVLLSVGFTACSNDDDETTVGWFITIDTNSSSGNYLNNIYLRSLLSTYINEKNDEILYQSLSESAAKSIFNTFCDEVAEEIDAQELPVLDDTYCVLYLSHSISDPNGTYPQVATKKITFTPSSE